MQKKEVTYHPVKIKDLVGFANKIIDNAKEGEFVPISDQRALAMANNPVADPNDLGMMAAFRGDEIVGYFGIMPINLWHNGNISKVHWFSTWNVSPKVRGQGVGSQLMAECLKWDLDFLIVGSKPARDVSRKFGFLELPLLKVATFDFVSFWRFNPITLLLRFFRKVFYLLRINIKIEKSTKSVNAWFQRVFGFLIKKLTYPILIKQSQNLDLITWNAVPNAKEVSLPANHEVTFYRDQSIINWMLQFPWVVSPGESRTEKMDFYFSDVKDEFENVALEIQANNKSIGFITYQYSSTNGISTVKIEDVNFSKPELLFAIACSIAKERNADKIMLNDAYIDEFRNKFMVKLLVSIQNRIYQCRPKNEKSPLGMNWEKIQLDFPDGDMGFS